MAITPKTVITDLDSTPNLQEQMIANHPNIFPYDTNMSLHTLIDQWEAARDSKQLSKAVLAKEIFKGLEQAPELFEPLQDPKVIEKHWDLIDLMVSGLLPSLKEKEYLGIIGQPFAFNFLYRSPAMQELMNAKGIEIDQEEKAEQMARQKIINGGILVLNKFYGQDINNDMSMMFSIKNGVSGIDSYYKGLIDSSLVEVRKKAPLKEISEANIRKLLSNIEDLDFWLEQIPADNFEFTGLIQVQVTDITQEQAYNNLKISLLEKNSVVDKTKLANLEKEMRNYLRSADIDLGLAGKGYGGDTIGFENGLWNCLCTMKPEYFENPDPENLYMKAIFESKLSVIDDLGACDNPSPYEMALRKAGYKSLIIAPLLDEAGNFIGVLELGSRKTNGFHAVLTEKLREILPVFTVALERAIEEKGNQVEVLIKQKYTSIHPSVEWRFIRAANKLLKMRQENPDHDTPEPISFKDVYPLYGQSDIVGSSRKRNTAIQKDLIKNLELLQGLLEPVQNCNGFPLIGVYHYRVGVFIENLKKNVNSGDEVRVTEFLTEEIQPLLENLSKHIPEFKAEVEKYMAELDPEMRVVYTQRKAYEESVSLLNDTLSRLIEQYQVEAQQVLPHYFEMYKTDGVEYNLYMGASMLNGRSFDEKYIENIRLWQLITMVAVTRKVEELQPKLKLPLRTAELILAFSNRIAIRFKTEEKQFDVDGAYNVRYEVIKKRIDKSKIKGTNERLTQTGKIAIVYTQEKERLEYLQFFEYLKAQNMIEDEVEELLIDDLQGVSGLRALRVKVIV